MRSGGFERAYPVWMAPVVSSGSLGRRSDPRRAGRGVRRWPTKATGRPHSGRTRRPPSWWGRPIGAGGFSTARRSRPRNSAAGTSLRGWRPPGARTRRSRDACAGLWHVVMRLRWCVPGRRRRWLAVSGRPDGRWDWSARSSAMSLERSPCCRRHRLSAGQTPITQVTQCFLYWPRFSPRERSAMP
jgi:hypothetical protein